LNLLARICQGNGNVRIAGDLPSWSNTAPGLPRRYWERNDARQFKGHRTDFAFEFVAGQPTQAVYQKRWK